MSLLTISSFPDSEDGYELLDATITYDAGDYSIALIGRNLTDEEYLAEVIPAPEFGGSFAHEGTSRRIGLELTYQF